MSINLDQPLKWTAATDGTPAGFETQKLLLKLQGNILKGHGRPEASLIFFSIDASKAHEARRALRELANHHITNAYRQLLDTVIFKETKVSGGPFVHLALAQSGYVALGLPGLHAVPEPTPPVFTSRSGVEVFLTGMRDPVNARDVADDPTIWESEFTQQIDGVLLVADTTRDATDELSNLMVEILRDGGCAVVKVQKGGALTNEHGVGIEHFGYVDGRSQPLLLVEDIDDEATDIGGGIAHWDAAFPLKTALVPDPGANDGVSFGSYFIFRKLEQNVLEFKRTEQFAADALGLKHKDRELAGALLVGRFEDGTPVTQSKKERGGPVPNDFNYDGDLAGSRCPFHAHIRKTNPRGSGQPTIDLSPEEKRSTIEFERSHIMARRGLPYHDVPRVLPTALPEVESFDDFNKKVAPLLPEKDIGLLFMAYNSDLANQFVFTQALWANNASFPFTQPGPHGLDPVIGQGKPQPGDQKLPKEWDQPAAGVNAFDFAGFVKMKGGEYFFSPSLTFLKGL